MTTAASTTAAPDRLAYTVPEVCNLLHLSRAKVYVLIRNGELPSVRIGGNRRIRRADLEAWLAEQS